MVCFFLHMYTAYIDAYSMYRVSWKYFIASTCCMHHERLLFSWLHPTACSDRWPVLICASLHAAGISLQAVVCETEKNDDNELTQNNTQTPLGANVMQLRN